MTLSEDSERIRQNTMLTIRHQLTIIEALHGSNKVLTETVELLTKENAGMKGRMDDLAEFQQLLKENTAAMELVEKHRAGKREKSVV